MNQILINLISNQIKIKIESDGEEICRYLPSRTATGLHRINRICLSSVSNQLCFAFR